MLSSVGSKDRMETNGQADTTDCSSSPTDAVGNENRCDDVDAADAGAQDAVEMTKLLLEHGADTSLLTNGHSPLSLAIVTGNDTVSPAPAPDSQNILDRCHTCDFFRTSALLYRATKSQTLRLCRVKNMASAPLFPFHDPSSETQFQNGDIVPYLIFSELFD